MNYFQPNDLKSAFDALNNNNDLIIAAGCTDLFPTTNDISLNKNVLDITNIKSIRGFEFNHENTKIGAATTWTDIINENLPSCYDMLKACAKEVGSIQIQNLGTIGGNICNASPAADSIPCLLSLDAKIELSSKNNKRIIPVDEFIFGARKTKLQHGEILTSIIIPKGKEKGFSAFKKIGARKYLVISISMVACYVSISNNIIEEIAISVGSCSEVAKRIFSIERQMIKKEINKNIFHEVNFSQLNEISPITDIRSTQTYRLKSSHSLIKDVIKDVINNYKISQ
tara:strand:- start:77 stop:928 length:852 start_codon:yes stop_codon:yes gene_type:complete